SFVPTPGHSFDHASIRLRARGEEALFAGDVMHHPLQVYAPDLNSCFCEYLDSARRSRRLVLEEAAERNTLVFSSHF
ncbi:MBL fold metallo-hydrolase, partial [Acinetobacter baumannii]